MRGQLLYWEVQIYHSFHCIGEKKTFSTVTHANEDTSKESEMALGSGGCQYKSRSVWSTSRKDSLTENM